MLQSQFFSLSRCSAYLLFSAVLLSTHVARANELTVKADNNLALTPPTSEATIPPLTLEPVDVAEVDIEQPFETWTAQTLEDFINQNSCFENVWDNYDQADKLTTRYEFAQALNNCLEKLEGDLPEPVSDQEDESRWPMVQGGLNGTQQQIILTNEQLESLQERIFTLEDNSFSTTTKLEGEIVFAYSDLLIDSGLRTVSLGKANGQDVFVTTRNQDHEAVFGGYGKVTLNTSFSGGDRLFLRFRGSGIPAFYDANELTGTNLPGGEIYTGETNQTFNLGANTNILKVQNLTLAYSFPVGDAGKLHVFGAGGLWSDFVPTLNPYFEDYDGGNGALSTFASHNPIYRIGGGSGLGLNYDLKFLESVVESATFSAGYLSPEVLLPDSYFGANPRKQFGLFNGDYALMLQTDFQISRQLALGLTYNHAYHPSDTAVFDMGGLGSQGVVGSYLANAGTIDVNAASPQVTNSYGLSMAWQPSDTVSISSFFTYTNGEVLGSANAGDYESWTYGMGLAFPDMFKDGSLLGLFAGAQPYVAGFENATTTFRNGNVPYHVELFYRYPVNKFISVTPGIIFLSAPNQVDDGAQIFSLRTTFKF